MTEAASEDSGDRRIAPRLPVGIVVAAIVIALGTVSALLYILYQETRGPGEILREFARRVDRADCAGSYDLLDQGVRSGMTQDQWCTEALPGVDQELDADFTLERAILHGDLAEVEVSGVTATEWELKRFGERSWRVIGPPGGFAREPATG